MALFSSSKYPATAKYEAEQKQLLTDYERFNTYSQSEELQRIKDLEILTNSNDFIKKVDKLKNEKFKHTQEFRQLSKYLSQKKSSEFKKYFKYHASGIPEKVESIENSEKRKELIELSEYTRSSEFISEKKQKGYKKSEAYSKFKQYKQLSKDGEIRLYNKQIKSALYKNYNNIHDSERLKVYQQLEQEVTSEKFLQFKSWMEDKKKFQKSEEYSLIQEYNNLLKSPDYIWYKKTEKQNNFSEITKWKLCFEDEFSSRQLNKDKWITGYYWGKALLNKNYVLENENQFFKDSNIEITGKGVSLKTKQENTEGLVWDSQRGFIPKSMDFTSGLISTGQSHRQTYGKIEAKVKIEHAPPVKHAFWLVGEKMAPQIDIFRFEDKNAKALNTGVQILNGNGPQILSKNVKGTRFDNDYYIYTLEWEKDKLSWYINGVKVNEQTNHVPNTPMYIVFSSHITDSIESLNASASINIEWIKCYQHNK